VKSKDVSLIKITIKAMHTAPITISENGSGELESESMNKSVVKFTTPFCG
jgi:hypothetical protein